MTSASSAAQTLGPISVKHPSMTNNSNGRPLALTALANTRAVIWSIWSSRAVQRRRTERDGNRCDERPRGLKRQTIRDINSYLQITCSDGCDPFYGGLCVPPEAERVSPLLSPLPMRPRQTPGLPPPDRPPFAA